jgi:hypothetical protein
VNNRVKNFHFAEAISAREKNCCLFGILVERMVTYMFINNKITTGLFPIFVASVTKYKSQGRFRNINFFTLLLVFLYVYSLVYLLITSVTLT